MVQYCLDCGQRIRAVPKPITIERAEAFVMPFGKHKGTRLVDCPADYIAWLAENADPKTALRALAMLVHIAGRR